MAKVKKRVKSKRTLVKITPEQAFKLLNKPSEFLSAQLLIVTKLLNGVWIYENGKIQEK